MEETKYSVARTNPRFAFVAEAEVTALWEGMRVVARVSELSSRGCYVDTINPFSMGSEVLLKIRYGCSTCEMPGKVIYTHSGFGMGLAFGEVSREHRDILESWLEELTRKSS